MSCLTLAWRAFVANATRLARMMSPKQLLARFESVNTYIRDLNRSDELPDETSDSLFVDQQTYVRVTKKITKRSRYTYLPVCQPG